MLKIILVCYIAVSAAFIKQPCAYWCEAPCRKKITSFYCCNYEPSLVGPEEFLPPPCPSLCWNRTGNAPSYLRNCKIETDNLRAARTFKICTNFNDCDPAMHDVCCSDNCLPEKRKMCIKL